MVAPSSNLKASASFDVRPARSQVVLVGLTVAAIIALLVGGTLLGLDKTSGWPFVIISAAIFASVIWCWRQSQRDTDLAQSHPTKVILADGANLSTDSRLLSSPEGLHNLSQVLNSLALRQPLPEPNGLIDPDGAQIPNSKQDAVHIVTRINAEIQKLHDQTISQLQQRTGSSVSQTPDQAKEVPQDATVETETRNMIFSEPSWNDRPS